MNYVNVRLPHAEWVVHPASMSGVTVKLPPREAGICRRLKEAREHLGLSQESFANEAGIPKSSLGNYELRRTPLRTELALRLCRQFVISEEWLATGAFAAIHAAEPSYCLNTVQGVHALGRVFMFQCLDLLAEPAARQVPHGMLFSRAYDEYLAPVYARLVKQFLYVPRIVLTEFDKPELARNILRVFHDRWFLMLANEAARLEAEPWEVQRSFLRALIEGGTQTFKAYMGFPRPEVTGLEYNFLRALATSTSAAIGPLHGKEQRA